MRQTKLLYKSMIKSQFNYCPLVWMFISGKFNNLANKIPERPLGVSYKDQKTSYENLLETHSELTIHQRNLQALMTEIYKIVNSVAPSIMNCLFEFRSNKYSIRNFEVLSTDFRRTVNYGIETNHPFGQNYHVNITLQLPLKNLMWKLRNTNVTHVPADYAKYFNQILGLLIRKMV